MVKEHYYEDDACFNTQPRGGGCRLRAVFYWRIRMFQHTAARRRLLLAGLPTSQFIACFNTQPRGGGCRLDTTKDLIAEIVSTHSRAEAAATNGKLPYQEILFQHTAARRRLLGKFEIFSILLLFQHTAARRRLLNQDCDGKICHTVSTHSRAEAAAIGFEKKEDISGGFNTQPRGGGCHIRFHTLNCS